MNSIAHFSNSLLLQMLFLSLRCEMSESCTPQVLLTCFFIITCDHKGEESEAIKRRKGEVRKEKGGMRRERKGKMSGWDGACRWSKKKKGVVVKSSWLFLMHFCMVLLSWGLSCPCMFVSEGSALFAMQSWWAYENTRVWLVTRTARKSSAWWILL